MNPCTLDRITRLMVQVMIDSGTPPQEAFDIVMDQMVRN